MKDQNRDNLKIDNSGTSFGVTNGNVTNDNRTMNGNNIVSGNQVNNALPERWTVAVICVTAIIALLILLCAFAFWCGSCREETAPVAVTNEIKIGPRGGVYYVDETGNDITLTVSAEWKFTEISKIRSKMRIKATLIAIFAIFLQIFVLTAAETVIVTSIHDGDSFRAGKQAFRLWGIDAPELDQQWGIAAREALRELLTGSGEVTVERHGTSWKRIVVRVESCGRDVSLELLKMGLAWYLPEFAPKRNDYREAEQEAREARRGLWSDEKPVSPAEWRKTGNNVISR